MKGLGGLHIAVIIAVVVGVVVVAVPSVGQSLISIITGPSLCGITPFAFNCYCNDGEDKTVDMEASGFGTTAYKCVAALQPVTYEFPLSSDDPEIQGKAFAYANDYINENLPACASLSSCSSPYWKDIGVSNDFAMVTCRESMETGGTVVWEVTFMLADGSAHPVLPSRCNM